MKCVHTVTWFEIPTLDIARAQKFYETVLDMKFEIMEMEGCKMAIMPTRGEPTKGEVSVHGALIQMEDRKPSDQGAMVYFNGGDDLSQYLAKVPEAGGVIIQEKTSIGEHGYFGMFKDTEGNVQALHSMN
jgi:predicted enzyme related to lactoylglutathione lyase